METPGFNRPISFIPNLPSARRLGRWINGSIATGTQMSVLEPTCSPENARGVTPTTAAGTPFTLMRLPRIAGSRLNRFRQ